MTSRTLVAAGLALALPVAAEAGSKLGFEYSIIEEGTGIETGFLRGFDIGEGLRVKVKLKQQSYCYMISRDDDGQFSLTFPDPRMVGQGPFSEARAKIPKTTFVKLEQTPDVERVYLIVASEQIPEIESALSSGQPKVPESLALEVRDRYQGGGAYERRLGRESIKVSWEPDTERAAVVVEEISIRARTP